MLTFLLYTGLVLLCMAFALFILRTGTVTRNDGTVIEPPFHGQPFWAQLLLSFVTILLLPILLFLTLGEAIRQWMTPPCPLESDTALTPTRTPKQQLDAAGLVETDKPIRLKPVTPPML